MAGLTYNWENSDTRTRSLLQTGQTFPTVGSQSKGFEKNADGSYDVYFAPKAPAGKKGNWLQTVPGKSWFAILRMYGPLEAWFDKTWRPGEIKLVKYQSNGGYKNENKKTRYSSIGNNVRYDRIYGRRHSTAYRRHPAVAHHAGQG